jgi:hypothetical protein
MLKLALYAECRYTECLLLTINKLEYLLLASMFSLVYFISKARVYSFRGIKQGVLPYLHQIANNAEILFMNKRSSFLSRQCDREKNGIVTLTPGTRVIELFRGIIYECS